MAVSFFFAVLFGNLIRLLQILHHLIITLIIMCLSDLLQKHREPRTEIKRIKNGFYKYQVAFVYSKEKKRTEKKTIRLLGKITEQDGFIPSPIDDLRRKSEALPKVDIKTICVFHLFSELLKEEIASLTEVSGCEDAERLQSFSLMRRAYQTSIKRTANYLRRWET